MTAVFPCFSYIYIYTALARFHFRLKLGENVGGEEIRVSPLLTTASSTMCVRILYDKRIHTTQQNYSQTATITTTTTTIPRFLLVTSLSLSLGGWFLRVGACMHACVCVERRGGGIRNSHPRIISYLDRRLELCLRKRLVYGTSSNIAAHAARITATSLGRQCPGLTRTTAAAAAGGDGSSISTTRQRISGGSVSLWTGRDRHTGRKHQPGHRRMNIKTSTGTSTNEHQAQNKRARFVSPSAAPAPATVT